MSPARASLLVALAAIVAAAAAAEAKGRSSDLAGPAPLAEDQGAVQVSVPAGAFFAEDARSLAAVLADPDGPAEVWLRERTYVGDFTVPRRVALRGLPGTVVEGTGAGTVLTVTADDAWIDNLVVRHSGRRHTAEDAGIKLQAARARVSHVSVEDTLFGLTLAPCPGCVLEHVRVRGTADDPELRGDGIKLWESSDAVVRDSLVEDSRDLVVWYSRRVLLERNVVRRSRYGSHFMYAHDSVVRDSRIESNVVGVFVMYSNRLHVEGNVLAGARGPAGVGIGFKESDGVDVRDNWIVANTTGAYIDRTPRSIDSPVAFERNLFALDEVALRLHSSEEGLSFVGNDFHENVSVTEVEGGGDALGVRFEGNHWTEYEGYDLDRDGRGDVAFQVRQLSGELTGAHPALQFFEGTGAMSVVDAVSHAVPVLAAHLVLVDPHPAMTATRPRTRS
jgi:nitrous oxidase accessory protein